MLFDGINANKIPEAIPFAELPQHVENVQPMKLSSWKPHWPYRRASRGRASSPSISSAACPSCRRRAEPRSRSRTATT
jgi:hypothetical protein